MDTPCRQCSGVTEGLQISTKRMTKKIIVLNTFYILLHFPISFIILLPILITTVLHVKQLIGRKLGN